MAEEQKLASFDPNEAEAQGLFDEGDFEIVDPKIGYFSYNDGTKGVGMICTLKGGDQEFENQFWSAGNEDKVAPNGTGTGIIFTGTTSKLNKKTNFVKLMASLVNVGVPLTLLQKGDITVLNGLKAHFARVANQDAQKNSKGEQPKVVLAQKLIALPGEKKASGGASKTTSTKATESKATESAPSGDLADKATLYVVKVLDANNGSVSKQKIAGEVFKFATQAKDADKVKLSQLVAKDEYLTAGGMVEVDGAMVGFEYDADSKTLSKIAA